MNTSRLIALSGLSLCLVSGVAWAQSTKPGLWEIQHKMGGNPEMDKAMAEMQKQLAAMPPEQRKMMQDMMAKQGGAMPTMGAGGGVAMKICITPEMAARNDMPKQTEGDCTTTVTSRSGNTMKMKFVCTNPPSSGEGTYTFCCDTAYPMKMSMTGQHQGKPQNMTMDGQGKWLSADCGSVKPMQGPGAKK